MSQDRGRARTLDVATLPTELFGSGGLTWWGTVGFMLIEGVTLSLCAASYLYLRRVAGEWPPNRTPLPSLGVPTANLIVLLAGIPIMLWAQRAARALDQARLRLALVVGALIAIATCVLRWFEFESVNTRWDSNAYGSIVWVVLGFHASLLVIEAAELIGTVMILSSGPVPERYFVDASDTAMYWYFMAGIWVPLYLLVYFFPRWV